MSIEHNELGSDLVIGATEIAKVLNWKNKKGGWDTRRVYHVCETRSLPVHHVKGLGICARRSSLEAFFAKLDAEFLEKEIG